MNGVKRFCQHCGTQVSAESRFCKSCGQACGQPSANAEAPSESGLVPCPKCHRTTETERVPALIARLKAIPSKEKPNEKVMNAEMEREELIEQLDQPEKPDLPSALAWSFVILIPLLGPLLALMAPLRRGLRYAMGGVTLSFYVALGINLFDRDFEHSGAFYFIGLFMLMFYWVALALSKGRNQHDYQSRLMPAYEHALPRWQRLCYCPQCKIVFLDAADDRRSASVSDAQLFLAGESGDPSRAQPPQMNLASALLCLFAGIFVTGALGAAAFLTFREEKPVELSPAEKEKIFKHVLDDLPGSVGQRGDPVDVDKIDKRPLLSTPRK